MASKAPFSGVGLSRDPLTEEEISQHREMFRELERAWPTVASLHSMSVGGQALGKLLGAGAIIGGAIALAVEKGWF